MDHFCYLCFAFAVRSCLFVVALWSPAEKGLISWFSYISCFIVFFVTFHVVSWFRCGTLLYRFLIFAFLLLIYL